MSDPREPQNQEVNPPREGVLREGMAAILAEALRQKGAEGAEQIVVGEIKSDQQAAVIAADRAVGNVVQGASAEQQAAGNEINQGFKNQVGAASAEAEAKVHQATSGAKNKGPETAPAEAPADLEKDRLDAKSRIAERTQRLHVLSSELDAAIKLEKNGKTPARTSDQIRQEGSALLDENEKDEEKIRGVDAALGPKTAPAPDARQPRPARQASPRPEAKPQVEKPPQRVRSREELSHERDARITLGNEINNDLQHLAEELERAEQMEREGKNPPRSSQTIRAEGQLLVRRGRENADAVRAINAELAPGNDPGKAPQAASRPDAKPPAPKPPEKPAPQPQNPEKKEIRAETAEDMMNVLQDLRKDRLGDWERYQQAENERVHVEKVLQDAYVNLGQQINPEKAKDVIRVFKPKKEALAREMASLEQNPKVQERIARRKAAKTESETREDLANKLEGAVKDVVGAEIKLAEVKKGEEALMNEVAMFRKQGSQTLGWAIAILNHDDYNAKSTIKPEELERNFPNAAIIMRSLENKRAGTKDARKRNIIESVLQGGGIFQKLTDAEASLDSYRKKEASGTAAAEKKIAEAAETIKHAVQSAMILEYSVADGEKEVVESAQRLPGDLVARLGKYVGVDSSLKKDDGKSAEEAAKRKPGYARLKVIYDQTVNILEGKPDPDAEDVPPPGGAGPRAESNPDTPEAAYREFLEGSDNLIERLRIEKEEIGNMSYDEKEEKAFESIRFFEEEVIPDISGEWEGLIEGVIAGEVPDGGAEGMNRILAIIRGMEEIVQELGGESSSLERLPQEMLARLGERIDIDPSLGRRERDKLAAKAEKQHALHGHSDAVRLYNVLKLEVEGEDPSLMGRIGRLAKSAKSLWPKKKGHSSHH